MTIKTKKNLLRHVGIEMVTLDIVSIIWTRLTKTECTASNHSYILIKIIALITICITVGNYNCTKIICQLTLHCIGPAETLKVKIAIIYKKKLS